MTDTPKTALTDCLYFLKGRCNKEKCRFRHCPEALTTSIPCALWPKCKNTDCPRLHPSMMSPTPNSTATAIDRSHLHPLMMSTTPISTTTPIDRPALATLPVQHRNTVSVFWDIENVAIPRGQKAFDIVMRLRERLVVEKNLTEDGFTAYCNCDILSAEHKIGLDKANVCIKNISSVKIGGADRHIFMDLQVFKEQHTTPATVVLISGDIDFIKYLNLLRFRHNHTVIIIHNRQAPSELVKTGNSAYLWDEFITVPADESLPNSNHFSMTPDFGCPNLPFKANRPRSPTNQNPVEKFKCPRCNETMFNTQSLENHQIQHKHWYDCNYPECHVACLTPESLQRHVKREHNDTAAAAANSATFPCGMCTKLFSTDARRAQHQQDTHDRAHPLESRSSMLNDVLKSDDKQSYDKTHSAVGLIDFDDDNYNTTMSLNLMLTSPILY